MARRLPRLDGAVREAVAAIIETEVNDPRLRLVTITEVAVTPDRKYATVYYSSIDPNLATGRDGRGSDTGDRVHTAEDVAEGLASAKPRIQGLMSKRLRMRATPDLRFEPDPTAGQSSRVEELLRQMKRDGN